jgi:hypothetical protein
VRAQAGYLIAGRRAQDHIATITDQRAQMRDLSVGSHPLKRHVLELKIDASRLKR